MDTGCVLIDAEWLIQNACWLMAVRCRLTDEFNILDHSYYIIQSKDIHHSFNKSCYWDRGCKSVECKTADSDLNMGMRQSMEVLSMKIIYNNKKKNRFFFLGFYWWRSFLLFWRVSCFYSKKVALWVNINLFIRPFLP